jgi:hypothetical protein
MGTFVGPLVVRGKALLQNPWSATPRVLLYLSTINSPMQKLVFSPDDSLRVEYVKQREGPIHCFIVYYKGSCWSSSAWKPVLKALKLGRGTATRDALLEWYDGLGLDQEEAAPSKDEEKPAEPPEKMCF